MDREIKKTYVLRKMGTGEILLEGNFHSNGIVLNIREDLKEIETMQKMYYPNYYVDELLLNDN